MVIRLRLITDLCQGTALQWDRWWKGRMDATLGESLADSAGPAIGRTTGRERLPEVAKQVVCRA